MHLIRRAAFRATSSPSTSFISKQRSITTSSAFALRSKIQSGIAPSVFRRFNSDDAREKSSVESADGEKGAVSEAIGSVSEYAKDAADSLTSNAEQAKNTISDAAAGAAAAAGIAYQPREDRRESRDRDSGYGGSRERRPYDNNRGGDRERRPYDNNRGGDRYGGSGDRLARPEREVTPSNSIYVGNLLFDITAADLQKEFEEFGTISNITIASDARGLSKGFGYVEFESEPQATAAIAAKHQSNFEGRRIVVNYQAKSVRTASTNPPSKTLFVGNLAFEMSDADLNKLFRDVRNVIDVRVAIDRRTGQPRGFAHADFVDEASATQAKEYLQDKEIYGRRLRIDYSAGPRNQTQREPPSY